MALGLIQPLKKSLQGTFLWALGGHIARNADLTAICEPTD
jgi:hypothetical protein